MSRVTNDVDNIQSALQQAFSQLVQSVMTVLGITVMMFLVSWQLALIALVALPLSGIIAGVIGVRSQKLFAAQWKHTGSLNGHVEESLSGLELVRAYGRDEEMLAEFGERNDKLFSASFGAQFVSGMIMPAMTFVSYLSYVLVAVAGGLRVASGQMTLGDATAFIQYSREFTQPISEIASIANMLQSGIASAERTFELLDAEEEEPEVAVSGLPTRRDEHVELDSVTFSYTPDEPLIEGLSLAAQPGHTIAIVGHTGAGKTTLVNLIMRFYELDGGRILVDGVDVRDLTRSDLRSQVGMVLQDSWLFAGTIRENIAYGRDDATDAEIVEAATRAHAHDFVSAFAGGYDTTIGERGLKLSGGQKQRIAVARAMIKDAPVLVLDEATSALDTKSERLVQAGLEELMVDRTSIIIAHRLSTISAVDTIVTLRDGRVDEVGTPEELAVSGGIYSELLALQASSSLKDRKRLRQLGFSA